MLALSLAALAASALGCSSQTTGELKKSPGEVRQASADGIGSDGGTDTCSDCIQDGEETDVDCGGPQCVPCADQLHCLLARDCLSAVCLGNRCQAPTCNDGVKNGGESDIDCGGNACSRCRPGLRCNEDGDCDSSVCHGVCLPATCFDGVFNGNETDVDCGGSCPSRCLNGRLCNSSSDCLSGRCVDNVCQLASCGNGVLDGQETDVDCGGPDCGQCADGKVCLQGSDCNSGVCEFGHCRALTCNNGIKDGNETDVDCGGSCRACAVGRCTVDGDCESERCRNGWCVPESCFDGVLNGDETDVDCGGSCGPCRAGSHCISSVDCQSLICQGGNCAPSCNDKDQDGEETDLDCGGPCGSNCTDEQACLSASDCQSRICVLHRSSFACGAFAGCPTNAPDADDDQCEKMEKYAKEKYEARKKPIEVFKAVIENETKVIFLGETHHSGYEKYYPGWIKEFKAAYENLNCLFLEVSDKYQRQMDEIQESGKSFEDTFKKIIEREDTFDPKRGIVHKDLIKMAVEKEIKVWVIDKDSKDNDERDDHMANNIKRLFQLEQNPCTRAVMIVGKAHIGQVYYGRDAAKTLPGKVRALMEEGTNLKTFEAEGNRATEGEGATFNKPYKSFSPCRWVLKVDEDSEWGFATPPPSEQKNFNVAEKQKVMWHDFDGYIHIKATDR